MYIIPDIMRFPGDMGETQTLRGRKKHYISVVEEAISAEQVLLIYFGLCSSVSVLLHVTRAHSHTLKCTNTHIDIKQHSSETTTTTKPQVN